MEVGSFSHITATATNAVHFANTRRAAASRVTFPEPPRGPRLREEAAEVQEDGVQARRHSCSMEGTGTVE